MQVAATNEMLNDAFWLGYLLATKKELSSFSQKEVISSFLIFFSSLFVCETLKAKYGRLTNETAVTLKYIGNIRNRNLKYCPTKSSNTTGCTIEEMGIDFNNYVFDLVLYIDDEDLLDVNFRTWDINKESNFESLDSIVATPLKWVEDLMPGVLEQVKIILSTQPKTHLKILEDLTIQKRSYSCNRLFKNSKISNDEKIYILQRYGLIKTTLLISNLLKRQICFDLGSLHFDSNKFINKVKAIIIEMFWEDWGHGFRLSILDEIFEKNKLVINDKFYAINRKCRDNLHYSIYNPLSEEEDATLTRYQNMYLHNALSVFDKNISYDFGTCYKIALSLAEAGHGRVIQRVQKVDSDVINNL